MWKYNNLDELYHHGILGMRWGRRKARYQGDKRSRRKAIKKELRNNRLRKAGLTTFQGVNALATGYAAYATAKAVKNKRYGKALLRTALTALGASNIYSAQKLKNDYTPKIKEGKEALKRLKYTQ